MRRKNWLSIIMTMTLTAGLLAGCGNENTSVQSTQGASETADGGSQEAVELELFSTKTENAAILQTIVDGFMKENESITITLTSEADASTVLKTRLTKNDIPEIVAMGGDAHYTELQSAGVLLDLSGEDFISEVQPAYLDMVYDVNGNQEQQAYGIPYATNASGVLYNEDLFAQAGVEVPQTWSDFLNVINKLEAAGI